MTGAVSTAQWAGAPLRSAIELLDTAVEVVFTGADGGEYRRSLPREVAMDPATLLAFEMNGEPIPARFGGPIRLIVPGWYGMASVKWVERIDAVEQPFQGEFQTRRYVYATGEPVTRMRIKSVFAEIPHWAPAGIPLRISGRRLGRRRRRPGRRRDRGWPGGRGWSGRRSPRLAPVRAGLDAADSGPVLLAAARRTSPADRSRTSRNGTRWATGATRSSASPSTSSSGSPPKAGCRHAFLRIPAKAEHA